MQPSLKTGSCMPVAETVVAGKLAASGVDVLRKPATDTGNNVSKTFGYIICTKTKLRSAVNEVNRLVGLRDTFEQDEGAQPPRGYQLNADARRWLSDVKRLEDTMNPMRKYIVKQTAQTTSNGGVGSAESSQNNTEVSSQNNKTPILWNPFKRYSIGRVSVKEEDEAKKLIEQHNSLMKKLGDPTLFVRAPAAPLELCKLPTTESIKYQSRIETSQKIISAINNAENHVIEVQGPGGIGKTTMLVNIAKLLGEGAERSKKFQRVVYVEVQKLPNVRNIQDQIASQLNVTLSNDPNEDTQRCSKLEQELRKFGVVLIILDDVWNDFELFEQLGLRSKEDFPDVKVLIGTRRTDLQHSWSTDAKIPINFLSEEDSWHLFKQVAGVQDSANTNMLNIANQIKDECGGLPLALAIIGKALNGQCEDTWQNALHYLKESNPKHIANVEKKVYRCIQYSYDHIKNKDTRRVFLLCSLFPEHQKVLNEDLTRYMIGEHEDEDICCLPKRRCLESCVKELVDFYLLHRTNEPRAVQMHDVVRDVAVYIAKEDKLAFINCGASEQTKLSEEHFKMCGRMSVIRSKITEVAEQPDCTELVMLLLRENRYLHDLPQQFFNKMKNLVVLDMSDSTIRSLPSSIKRLTNLGTLSLNGCKSLCSVEMVKNLKKLRVLSLRECGITSLPSGMKNLQNLKVLDLNLLRDLQVTRELFSGLRQLEELHLDSKSVTETVLVEIANLRHLKSLELYVGDVNILSSFLVPTALIENWNNFFVYNNEFPGQRAHQKCLHIKGAPTISPWVKSLVAEAQDLIFDECFRDQDNWPDMVAAAGENKFLNSKVIRLRQCNSIKYLCLGGHATDRCFTELEEIYLTNLAELIGISEGTTSNSSFEKVMKICMKDCGKVKHVIPYGLLQSVHYRLKEISVTICVGVQTIFQFDNTHAPLFPNLRLILLVNLPALTSICLGTPPGGTFANLKELIVEGCSNLTSLFTTHMAMMLTSLEKLMVESNRGLTEIVQGDDTLMDRKTFPKVTHLSLLHLDRLLHFHKGGENITSLEWPMLNYLKLGGCPHLARLPIALEDAPNLKKIELNSPYDHIWYGKLNWDDANTPLRFEVCTSSSAV